MQFSLTSAVVNLAPTVGGGGSDGTSLPIIPHWGEFIYGSIVFLIFLFLIWKFALPKLEEAYVTRVEAIEGDMSRADRALAEANAIKAKYEALLEEAHLEANRLREEGRVDGAEIAAQMRAAATREAARILDAAHRQVQTDRALAMNQLKSEVGRMSADLAGRIVGESLRDDARSAAVIERFIADLESGKLEAEVAKLDRAGG